MAKQKGSTLMKDSARAARQWAKQFHEILESEPGLLDLMAIREWGSGAFTLVVLWSESLCLTPHIVKSLPKRRDRNDFWLC